MQGRCEELLASGERKGRNVWIRVDRGEILKVLGALKECGYVHLSMVNVTDWPDRGVMEVDYFLYSPGKGEGVVVTAEVERDDPRIPSAYPVFGESAQIHEREEHEMFGVVFEGNPDLSPLFLEDWDGPPPFRKDFDWRKYVRERFYDRENPMEEPYWRDVR